MSKRSFTEEEMALLKENKYTYSVSPNTICFTIAFKKEFWKRYINGERPREIVQALGYDYELLGETRVSGIPASRAAACTSGVLRPMEAKAMRRNATAATSIP